MGFKKMIVERSQGKILEERLLPWEESTRSLRLLHSVADYIYSFTLEDGEPVSMHHGEGCQLLTGYSRAELEARPFLFWRQIVCEEDRPLVLARLAHAFESNNAQTIEHRINHKTGFIRWVQNTVVPARDSSGQIIGGDGVVRDISEQRRTQQLLELQLATSRELGEARTVEEGVRRMLSGAGPIFRQFLWDVAALWMVDEQAKVLRCKESWCSTASAKPFKTFAANTVYREGEGLAGRVWATAAPGWWTATGTPSQQEHCRLTGLQELCAFPVFEEKRVVAVLELLGRRAQEPDPDILKGLIALAAQLGQFMVRRKAEETLATESNLLRTMIDALPVYVYVKDRESRFVLNNQAHIGILGATHPEDVLGKTDLDFFPRELALAYKRDEENVLESGFPLMDREEPVLTAGGKHLWVLTSKVPLRDTQGRIFGVVGVTRDITDRKQAEENLERAYRDLENSQKALKHSLEELEASNTELRTTQLQLIHAAKLESVGALAAAVAHEVKNPLQSILLGVDYLENNLVKGNPELPDVVREVREAVSRAKGILGDLLELAAASRIQMTQEDLNPIIEHSLRFVHFDLVRGHVELQTHLSPDLIPVKIDKGKIEQVFLNLFINALQAMPQGGVLSVSSKCTRLDREYASCPPEFSEFAPGADIVLVEVRDSGTGIPPQNLDKVFDTFFTTKAPGIGTGLGLSIVRKIMKLHQGAVRIQNAHPSGVLVTLLFRGGKNAR